MSADYAESVSKGVFVHKGTKKRAKAENYYDQSDGTIGLIRKMISDNQWEKIDAQIQVLQQDLNTKIFDDLVSYVGAAHCATEENRPLIEIPTAALVTGVNMPDHALMFANLVRLLHDRVTRHVAILRSKDCPNIRSVMAKTVAQIIGHEVTLEDEEDDMLNLSKISSTFATLASWYENSQKLRSPKRSLSPRKRPASTPLVDTSSPTKKPSSPRRQILSPNYRQSPRKQPASPRKGAASPRKIMESPRKGMESPRKSMASPRKGSVSPTKSIASPRKRTESPRKQVAVSDVIRSPTEHMRTPVVIVIEDLEGFSSNVLQDFVTICSNHLSRLPIVLVFGIATAVTTVHRLLPSGVSSLMCIEKFQAPPSSEYLTSVIDKVVMTSELPFKLGDKVFTLLLDLFLFHDFSVINFIRGLQLALIEHYYNNSSSILCQPLPKALTCLQSLKAQHVETITQIPSVASYIEGKSDNERKQLSTDVQMSKSLIRELLTSLDHYHHCFFPVLRCLHACTGTLPKYPLGKQVRELYATCLATNVCDSEEYKESMLLLRTLSRDDLLIMMTKCSTFLKDKTLPKDDFSELQKAVQEYAERLENVEELAKPANPEEEEEQEENINLEGNKKEKLRLHDLKQKLQAMEKKKKKLSVYEVLRTDAVDMMEKMFRKYLPCPSSFPLHEVFYYNNATSLRQHISASPRATIQRGLADPHFYIKHASLQCTDGYIAPSLPDISIVYKLHLECGRLINLYDWMQAFAMIVQSGKEDDNIATAPKHGGDIDKILHARFIRAVSELQFLGFIKTTKRKTDHVARLTWGGC